MRNGLDGMKAGIIQLLDVGRSDAVFLEEFEGLVCDLFEKKREVESYVYQSRKLITAV